MGGSVGKGSCQHQTYFVFENKAKAENISDKL